MRRLLNRMFLTALPVAALVNLGTANLAYAQETGSSPGAVADAYLAKYSAGDIDGLGPLLAPEAVFEDPSMELQGREAILDGLRNVFAALSIEGFDVSQRIESGAQHVMVLGQVRFSQDGATVGMAGERFEFETPLAVSLKIVGGKVTRHVDFVATRVYMDQLRQQMKAKQADG